MIPSSYRLLDLLRDATPEHEALELTAGDQHTGSVRCGLAMALTIDRHEFYADDVHATPRRIPDKQLIVLPLNLLAWPAGLLYSAAGLVLGFIGKSSFEEKLKPGTTN